MRLPLFLTALALLAAGCTTPGARYAAQHPELPPAHRQILATGDIPPGAAVAGMTREQVKLALRSEPATYDRIGDEDVWIFTSKVGIGRPGMEEWNTDRNARRQGTQSFTQTSDFSPRVDVNVNTMVFFVGDRATRATVTRTED